MRRANWSATMAHPLNRPRFDAGARPRRRGLRHPAAARRASACPAANRSRFARSVAGEPGIDPYTRAVSDVYQDVFAEGSFVGKGIYDVDAVRRALAGRLPENRVLSHDLLEGAYARAGLVSDVVLLEEQSSSYATDAGRRHRWIRGDWQIVGWLLPRVPGADRARRQPPCPRCRGGRCSTTCGAASCRRCWWRCCWSAGRGPPRRWPGRSRWPRSLFLPGLLASAAALLRDPPIACAAVTLARARPGPAAAARPRGLRARLPAVRGRPGRRRDRPQPRPRGPHRATAPAVAHRRRRAARARRAGLLAPAYRVDVEQSLLRRSGLPRPSCASRRPGWASPRRCCALWPALAVGRVVAQHAARRRRRPVLSPSEEAVPATASRGGPGASSRPSSVPRTTTCRPTTCKPYPPQRAAHRTSPTNIGLALTASLAAHDFGYITAGEVVARTTRTLASLDRMERYRGHFYNWYDTTTLAPLRPIYVSTVDSGNLAGHLLTLRAGLLDERRRPGAPHRLAREVLFAGACVDALHADPSRRCTASLRSRAQACAALALRAMALRNDAATIAVAAQRRSAESRGAGPTDPGRCALDAEGRAPRTPNARAGRAATRFEARVPRRARRACRHWRMQRAGEATTRRRRAARAVDLPTSPGRRAELADDGLRLPLRPHAPSAVHRLQRHRPPLDPGCYDLLASEARLASFVAIAQGDSAAGPLVRPGTAVDHVRAGGAALLSWSGSMFEYLMPLLVMPTYPATLLDETYRAVVERQIAYGRERGVPWGISESGYNKTDAQLNYQYRAFGVPGLGFKRGLGDDLVIAPYASAMALMVAPHEATANLQRLAASGHAGEHGFYEAIDYTAARLPPGTDHVTVRSYMAHHQGMALLALAYVLLDRPMQRRFAADPAFRATELLLQERIPARAAPMQPHPAEVSAARAAANAGLHLRVFPSPHTAIPEVAPAVERPLPRHGHQRGRRLQPLARTWRSRAGARTPPATAGARSATCATPPAGAFWSVALPADAAVRATATRRSSAGPRRVPPPRRGHRHARRDHRLARGRRRSCGGSRSPTAAARRATIELTSLRGGRARGRRRRPRAPGVQQPVRADRAGPPTHQAILCTRRPRSAGETPPWMFHLMSADGAARRRHVVRDRPRGLHRSRPHRRPTRAAMDGSPRRQRGRGARSDRGHPPTSSHRAPTRPCARTIVTGVAETRAARRALIEKYRDRHALRRAPSTLAWTQSQVVQRQLEASNRPTGQLFEQPLAGARALRQPAAARAPRSLIARNRSGQSGLWAYGISGDLPIVLVRIADVDNIELVRQVARAHAYWRLKGLNVDLVIWNEDRSGYRQDCRTQITAESVGGLADGGVDDRPGRHLRACAASRCRGRQGADADRRARVIATRRHAATLAEHRGGARLPRAAEPAAAAEPPRPRAPAGRVSGRRDALPAHGARAERALTAIWWRATASAASPPTGAST